MDIRQKFEAWAKSEGYSVNRERYDKETYVDARTHCGWWAYQAAHSSQQEDRDDAERYRFLRDRFLGADFDYGGTDTENGRQVLLITHEGTPVWGSLDLTVDAARAALNPTSASGAKDQGNG
jgi:hypothetical protein